MVLFNAIKKIKKLSLKAKIIFFFLFVYLMIMLFIILPLVLYITLNQKSEVKELSAQTLYTIDAKIEATFENYNKIIEIILLNNNFQSVINQSKSILIKNQLISNALYEILLSDSSIMSVLYDDKGEYYSVVDSRGNAYKVNQSAFKTGKWEKLIEDIKGEIGYVTNGGGVMQLVYQKEPVEFLSFVKNIPRLDDYSQMGTLIFNINKNVLPQTFFGEYASKEMIFIIYDKNKAPLFYSNHIKYTYLKFAQENLNKNTEFIIDNIDGEKVAFNKYKSTYSDWNIVSIIPLAQHQNTMVNNYILFALIALVTIGLLFLGQFFITSIVIKPLAKMGEHMNRARDGEFIPIDIPKSVLQDEITELKIFFNSMIVAIDDLTEKIKQEEELKKNSEISLLQAQIKPHFLYNALDAVSALTLIEENEKAYELTQALSFFYRTSLSVGKDIVSVATEIDCIKNYITVLNIRYQNAINISYNISENILDILILKLTLQPIIENAVYHGLRKKEGSNIINIIGYLENNFIVFEIFDDGIGITKSKINDILSGKSKDDNNGFGLYSLMKKLNMYNNQDNSLYIDSVYGEWTKVVVKIIVKT